MNMKKAEVYGKRIECLIGLILLIPPILGVAAFTISIFAGDTPGSFARMTYLSSEWTALIRVPAETSFDGLSNGIKGSAGAMSAAPIYLGLMAMVGAYLVKNNIQSFFMKGE